MYIASNFMFWTIKCKESQSGFGLPDSSILMCVLVSIEVCKVLSQASLRTYSMCHVSSLLFVSLTWHCVIVAKCWGEGGFIVAKC